MPPFRPTQRLHERRRCIATKAANGTGKSAPHSAGAPFSVAPAPSQKGISMTRYLFAGLAVAGFAALAATSVPARAASITLVNASPASIDRFYVAPCRSRSWGPDLTGARRVPPGTSFTIDVPHGCYDLKVTTHRGRDCIVTGARLFGAKAWTITRAHLRACS
jgi:hypothetical protein